MQPNDPLQQSPQVPSDYLNQIAAPAQVKTLNPLLLWGLIGGLLILGVIIILAISSSARGPSSSSLAAVAAKLSNLKTLSEKASDNIQSSELRTINSSLTLVLTNTNRDLAEPLKVQNISLKDKKNKAVVAAAKDLTSLESRLEDARLNAAYDRTYAREMTYALKTLQSDMTVLYKKSRSKSLKTALDTGYENLAPLTKDFENFNAS
jgi:hypothetical protein